MKLYAEPCDGCEHPYGHHNAATGKCHTYTAPRVLCGCPVFQRKRARGEAIFAEANADGAS